MRADIHAPSWPLHALQVRNRRNAARVITQKDADNFFHAFALDDEVINVAFLFEDARDFKLQFRRRNIDARVFGLNRVADSRQHVGNRISHSLTPKRPLSVVSRPWSVVRFSSLQLTTD